MQEYNCSLRIQHAATVTQSDHSPCGLFQMPPFFSEPTKMSRDALQHLLWMSKRTKRKNERTSKRTRPRLPKAGGSENNIPLQKRNNNTNRRMWCAL